MSSSLTLCLAGNPAKRVCVDAHCSVANPFLCEICQPTKGCRNMHPGCPDKPWAQIREYLQKSKAISQAKYLKIVKSIDSLIRLGQAGLRFIRKEFDYWRENAGLSAVAIAVQSKIKKGHFSTLTGKMLAETYQTIIDPVNMKIPEELLKECQVLQDHFQQILIKMQLMFLGKNQSKTLSQIYKCIHRNELVYKVEDHQDMYLFQHIRHEQLRKLDLHGSSIRDIKPLIKTQFPFLNVLSLTNGSIQSIEPLAQISLKNLTKLSLQQNKISDISVLPKINMPQLQALNLSRNLIGTVYPLQGCVLTDLQVLDVSNNKIKDPYPILRANFPRLDLTNGLDITDNPINEEVFREFQRDARQIQLTKKESNTSSTSETA